MRARNQQGDAAFVAVVSSELRRQGLGVRTLARLMVDLDPTVEANKRSALIEQTRRLLRKWLAMTNSPTPESRDRVADALGIDRALLRERPTGGGGGGSYRSDADNAMSREMRAMREEIRSLHALVARVAHA